MPGRLCTPEAGAATDPAEYDSYERPAEEVRVVGRVSRRL